MAITKVTGEFGGKPIEIETGKLALQANGSCTVRYGDTVVLGTACMAPEPTEGADFFPLTIDYEEKMYAAGKITGSRFLKREGRPSETAILNSRLIDRSVRPLFPKGFTYGVQVVTTVLSADDESDPAVASIIAASAALMLSGMPFEGPIAAARIGIIDEKLVLNPTSEQLDVSKLDLVVSSSKDAIVMVEAGANEITEEVMLQAFEFAHRESQKMIELQNKLVKELKVKKVEYKTFIPGDEVTHLGDDTFRIIKLTDKITEYVKDSMLDEIVLNDDKASFNAKRNELLKNVIDKYSDIPEFPVSSLTSVLDTMIKKRVRYLILENGKRPDGRAIDQIRPLSMEVSVLPMTHGSALFNRGETQSLTIVTLAAKRAGQLIENMQEDYTKYYMHHYNFPPYSVGEARSMRSPGRREIGHGHLAERALVPMIPSIEDFPYTIRVVTEILGSSGSTSMASVCGSTLSLMDAGVPIKKPVAGIAMGLMSDKEKGVYKILTDIKDIEDFGGDMDFKVAGTRDGITAIQMDIKIKGLTLEILKEGLAQAKIARFFILDTMQKVIAEPRKELSKLAPRVSTLKIDVEQIRDVIGSGGKVINKIIEDTGVEIDIEEDGTIHIFSMSEESSKQAIDIINGITYEFQVGDVFEGKVSRIISDRNTGKEIGVIVERSPNKDGMVHISELANTRIAKISEVCKIGDVMKVKVIGLDPERGRVNLSRKALLNEKND